MILSSRSGPFPAGSWRVVIEDRQGKPELEINNLEPIAGRLHLLLLPGSLPGGEHHLRVYSGVTPWPQVFALDLDDG